MFKQPETRGLLGVATLIVVVGILFYMRVEHWTLVDAFYFCVVTMATVGYGDITPTTDVGKIFTTVYIIVGLSILGGFFATAGRLLIPTVALEEKGIMKRLHKESEPNADEEKPE
jgi:hypothetical protein